MSNSTKPRVVRKNHPKRPLTRTGYRDAWDYLTADFHDRCAYSMQHTYRAGGKRCMEVDHFNPTKKSDPIQQYTNLFLATRHCNGAKRDRWPDKRERQLGARFLNCCAEADYGVHIFEDPDTHEVVGTTPQGIYHVRHCDLNAPHLVRERAERAKLWNLLRSQPFELKSGFVLPPAVAAIRSTVETMIPEILYLSGDALEKRRAMRKAIATLGAQ